MRKLCIQDAGRSEPLDRLDSLTVIIEMTASVFFTARRRAIRVIDPLRLVEGYCRGCRW
jgi:hypothetical protein